MKKRQFSKCRLTEADFSCCDLTGAVFEGCDLGGAVFDETILEQADLRTAYHFIIDPDRNRLKKARFSLQGLPGLLNASGIEIETDA